MTSRAQALAAAKAASRAKAQDEAVRRAVALDAAKASAKAKAQASRTQTGMAIAGIPVVVVGGLAALVVVGIVITAIIRSRR